MRLTHSAIALAIALAVIAAASMLAHAERPGDLDPPAGPIRATAPSLEDINNRLERILPQAPPPSVRVVLRLAGLPGNSNLPGFSQFIDARSVELPSWLRVGGPPTFPADQPQLDELVVEIPPFDNDWLPRLLQASSTSVPRPFQLSVVLEGPGTELLRVSGNFAFVTSIDFTEMHDRILVGLSLDREVTFISDPPGGGAARVFCLNARTGQPCD